MTKEELLESKVRELVSRFSSLRKDHERLQREAASLRAQLEMLTGEHNKAQRILASTATDRRLREQVTHRIERALSKLTHMGVS